MLNSGEYSFFNSALLFKYCTNEFVLSSYLLMGLANCRRKKVPVGNSCDKSTYLVRNAL